jgi:hypothetical protein
MLVTTSLKMEALQSSETLVSTHNQKLNMTFTDVTTPHARAASSSHGVDLRSERLKLPTLRRNVVCKRHRMRPLLGRLACLSLEPFCNYMEEG